jgi:hypothetical protein
MVLGLQSLFCCKEVTHVFAGQQLPHCWNPSHTHPKHSNCLSHTHPSALIARAPPTPRFLTGLCWSVPSLSSWRPPQQPYFLCTNEKKSLVPNTWAVHQLGELLPTHGTSLPHLPATSEQYGLREIHLGMCNSCTVSELSHSHPLTSPHQPLLLHVTEIKNPVKRVHQLLVPQSDAGNRNPLVLCLQIDSVSQAGVVTM